MKKLVAVLLTLALCLSLSAASAQEDTTLVYWDMIWSNDPNYQPTVQSLCDQFTAETGIKIDLQFIGWDNHYQTFLTAINSGVGPDVSPAAAIMLFITPLMDLTLPLDSIVEEWKTDGSNIDQISLKAR